MIRRSDFLRLAGMAAGVASLGLLDACAQDLTGGTDAEMPEGRREAGDGKGRLLARPSPSRPAAAAGLRPLGLGSGRDGLLYVPPGYDGAEEKAPLALMLHGAGGDARSGISHFLGLADEAGLVLLAPESRGRTWDVLAGGYGPDVAFIDRALGQTVPYEATFRALPGLFRQFPGGVLRSRVSGCAPV